VVDSAGGTSGAFAGLMLIFIDVHYLRLEMGCK